MAVQSSCLCGSVRWQVEGPFQFMSHCHCGRCRKAHGSSFATHVAASAAEFRLTGEEHVVSYQSSGDLIRKFCGVCGSVVPGDPWQGLVFVPAGNFESDPEVRPLAHIFVGSKAPWYEIGDQALQYEAYPPGADMPALPDLPRPAEGFRGSCLCGAVAFVIEGTPTGCWNCHCGRCRKARSAAHASNLFLPAENLRFLQGEDQNVAYKVPEAQRFTQTFCRTCGAVTARHDPVRGLGIVPLGSLDGDTPLRPQAHIFVGSKAPWFEITDALPQFSEYPA